jgi:hypothetical protein
MEELLMTTTTNGRDRKSLAEQIDRLDGILDGLAPGLEQAVVAAVQAAVGLAVREAVQAQGERTRNRKWFTHKELRHTRYCGSISASPWWIMTYGF